MKSFFYLFLALFIHVESKSATIEDPVVSSQFSEIIQHLEMKYWTSCLWDKEVFLTDTTFEGVNEYYTEINCHNEKLQSKIGIWYLNQNPLNFYAEGYAVSMNENWYCIYDGSYKDSQLESHQQCTQLEKESSFR